MSLQHAVPAGLADMLLAWAPDGRANAAARTATEMQRIADVMHDIFGAVDAAMLDSTLTPEEARWNTLMGQPMGHTVTEPA